MKSRVELSWPHQLGHIAKEHREQTHVWWGTITAVQSELAKNISASRMRGCVIVENNVINQKVVGRMLAKLGLTYTVARAGTWPFSTIVLGGSANLVLMDYQTPVLEGYEATKQIRAWEAETGRARLPCCAAQSQKLARGRCCCGRLGALPVCLWTVEYFSDLLRQVAEAKRLA